MDNVDMRNIVLEVLEESYNFNLFSSEHRNTIADTVVARLNGDESARSKRNIKLPDDGDSTYLSDDQPAESFKIGITVSDLGLDFDGNTLEPLSKDPMGDKQLELKDHKKTKTGNDKGTNLNPKVKKSRRTTTGPDRLTKQKHVENVELDNVDKKEGDGKKKKILRGHNKSSKIDNNNSPALELGSKKK